MKLKIKIPIPLIGSLEVLEVPLSKINYLEKLGFGDSELRDSYPSEKVYDLLEHCLEYLFQDQYDTGEARGGWGKDYRDKYFRHLFGDEVPTDALVHPHSISFSLWVLEGLVEFERFCQNERRPLKGKGDFHQIFNEISDYYRRHFDELTGGVGPKWSGTDMRKQVAPNVRHASSGIVAFLILPGFLKEVQQTASYILKALESGTPFEESRALSVAAMLRALFAIQENRVLSHGLSIDEFRFRRLISKGEIELLSRYDNINGTWDTNQTGAENARIWYSIWILRSLPQLQYSSNEDIKKLYGKCLKRLIEQDLIKTKFGKGLPYKPDGNPDLGLSASLLAILQKDEMIEENKRNQISKSILNFLVHEHRDPDAIEYTYSWTWAMVLIALLSK